MEGVIAQVKKFEDVPGALGGEVSDVATIKGLEVIFNNILTIALGLVAIVLFVMLILGGFSLLTAGGNAQQAEGAKKTVTYAILGMVFIIMSYLIFRFIASVAGIPVDILNFKIVGQ